jgi:hypothetical protein
VLPHNTNNIAARRHAGRLRWWAGTKACGVRLATPPGNSTTPARTS